VLLICCSDSLLDTDDSHPLLVFPCGLTAGCLAAMATHPADVIKTRLQLKQSQRGATRHAVRSILQVRYLLIYGMNIFNFRQSCVAESRYLEKRKNA